jgi:hypothetical protein
LLISSLKLFHGFSRGAGFSFFVLSFLVIKLKGPKWILIALISALLGYHMGSVGLDRRGDFKPGLSSYLSALIFQERTIYKKKTEVFLSPDNNPLDALAPWSRKAQARQREKPDALITGFKLLWNLNPLPSEFVPLFKIGRSLSEIMKTWGHTGLTTPALAELYYALWVWGCLAGIPLGMVYGWFEKQNTFYPSWYSQVALLFCFLSLPIGLHSSLRSMTRPLLYAFVFYFLGRKLTAMSLANTATQSKT